MMTVELFDYGNAEQWGGKSFCSNQEGFAEERAFEPRFQRGFFMQRSHRLLPRPGVLSIDRFEPESMKSREEGQKERRGMGALEELNGQGHKGPTHHAKIVRFHSGEGVEQSH